ncbi:PD-(D/E)XK nuclease family protein [Echinicola strongylocentroti]|uniref:PD-(D/E)XK nuclease family protein n=1 Tax=Echinicola strongylocentroti TaxID=1795355 RepID=A0A2Z4IE60_9BACT|nr:PD-(D/E)XK nuclease family protein [Echinicola strongylocentroti]AWW29361.1 PD-(D/E)XK nuclease family protein [Echinicola strongylocentroti]
MESFLKDTAADLLRKYDDMSKVAVVLPNRRAGLFFVQHLGQLIDRPQWMPAVLTVEELFYKLANKKPADQLTLIFELYRVYNELQADAEPFDRFYFWGEMILKDFNDIDQFLVDPSKLYKLVAEIKEIETDLSFLTESQIELVKQFWKSFEREGRGSAEGHKDRFIRYWELLLPLYKRYKRELAISDYAYSGMLYREVAENMRHMKKPSVHYAFVGFNAFTGTEELLVKHFVSQFGASIYWDLDAFYIHDSEQEAGLFFREYRKDKVLGPTFPEKLPQRIKPGKAKVKVYQTPLKVNQSNLIGSVLEGMGKEENPEETVVILPDEQLLFPVMNQLPTHIGKVNVTMGYPIRNAPVYAFLEAVLELQRYVKVDGGEVSFYHQPVKELLSSTYLKSENPDFVSGLLEGIQRKNQVYIPQEELKAGGRFFELIFQKLDTQGLFIYLESLMVMLAEGLEEEQLQRSYLYQCHKQLTRLKDVFQQQEEISINLEFFIRLFRQVFREVRLPFEGEPLAGLQVMGVLESRNLDFKRVIIANMNEGSFPPSGTLNSLIPFNIRKAFGLPVQEQNDAIYAYTFYRLLHRAEEVHMIYWTASDQGKVGEMSRYIRQMMMEMNSGISEEVVFVPVDVCPEKPITIEKTDEVMQLLSKYLVRQDGTSPTAFSPSALSIWLDCRLKFYLRYLANINEKDKVEEEVNAAVFGNLAHYSLEYLYKGFMDRKKRNVVQKEDVEQLKKYIFPSIEKAIREFYYLEDEADTRLSGQLAIVRDVMQKYIEELLKWDEVGAPFQLISLEKDTHYRTAVSVEANGQFYQVALKGIIDRVDNQDGIVRLIDYKSGQDVKDFPSIPSLFARDDPKRNKAAMQTMIYGLLYQHKFPDNKKPLKPAIFNLREIFNEDFNPYLQLKEGRGGRQELENYLDYEIPFEEGLREMLSEIFDKDVPFDQTEDLKKCEYCPYKEICGR